MITNYKLTLVVFTIYSLFKGLYFLNPYGLQKSENVISYPGNSIIKKVKTVLCS